MAQLDGIFDMQNSTRVNFAHGLVGNEMRSREYGAVTCVKLGRHVDSNDLQGSYSPNKQIYAILDWCPRNVRRDFSYEKSQVKKSRLKIRLQGYLKIHYSTMLDSEDMLCSAKVWIVPDIFPRFKRANAYGEMIDWASFRESENCGKGYPVSWSSRFCWTDMFWRDRLNRDVLEWHAKYRQVLISRS